MPTLRQALSLALLLSACTTHDDGAKPAAPVKPEVESVKPEPVKPLPAVTVAVASVQLIQDCPDPAEPAAAAEPASAAEPAAAAERSLPAPVADVSAKQGSMATPGPMARMREMAPGSGRGLKQPCTQSTLQLALQNPGKVDATLRVEAVRLVDAASKKVLGPLVARKPSLWSDVGSYQPWDERVTAGAQIKVGYRLAEPDWSQVTATLGPTVNLYAQPFVLEVDVSIDGTRQTLRSPEFLRERVHMIAT